MRPNKKTRKSSYGDGGRPKKQGRGAGRGGYGHGKGGGHRPRNRGKQEVSDSEEEEEDTPVKREGDTRYDIDDVFARERRLVHEFEGGCIYELFYLTHFVGYPEAEWHPRSFFSKECFKYPDGLLECFEYVLSQYIIYSYIYSCLVIFLNCISLDSTHLLSQRESLRIAQRRTELKIRQLVSSGSSNMRFVIDYVYVPLLCF